MGDGGQFLADLAREACHVDHGAVRPARAACHALGAPGLGDAARAAVTTVEAANRGDVTHDARCAV